MSRESPGWQQHFPTYRFEGEEIALEEYRSATKILENEGRQFVFAANISLAISAAIASLVAAFLDKLTGLFAETTPPIVLLTILLGYLLWMTSVLTKHFADGRRAITYAARKVIVLRRMLGMSYGHLHLVLPNWRIEGADQPFSIRIFPGWNSSVGHNFFLVAGLSTCVSFFICTRIAYELRVLEIDLPGGETTVALLLSSVAAALLGLSYRKALLERHERIDQVMFFRLAALLGLGLERNVEEVIYRAKLAAYETSRLKLYTPCLADMLVSIEDREFRNHGGVSWRGLVRMVRSAFGLGPRSGGVDDHAAVVPDALRKGIQQTPAAEAI